MSIDPNKTYRLGKKAKKNKRTGIFIHDTIILQRCPRLQTQAATAAAAAARWCGGGGGGDGGKT